ncbi:hypothetical protein AVEN_274226-1 [Araneus ventricosus]|uniref:Uncharacterized protein n=1 Tax=Araneus ventricosus TaxID=182803 RepID=A0A4Y2G567_ARAVE|nr:hypothetical protein AVEN_274226-1 [Araneus ventricosus]
MAYCLTALSGVKSSKSGISESVALADCVFKYVDTECVMLENRLHTFVEDKFHITTTNIDVSGGLANGAHGKLVHVEFNEENNVC